MPFALLGAITSTEWIRKVHRFHGKTTPSAPAIVHQTPGSNAAGLVAMARHVPTAQGNRASVQPLRHGAAKQQSKYNRGRPDPPAVLDHAGDEADHHDRAEHDRAEHLLSFMTAPPSSWDVAPAQVMYQGISKKVRSAPSRMSRAIIPVRSKPERATRKTVQD